MLSISYAYVYCREQNIVLNHRNISQPISGLVQIINIHIKFKETIHNFLFQ